ncbi:MAG: serine/threonine protein kinase [Planctomycetes bacterium]|nr:serine/threonine protein kinase [Planctomycetota bacterium]
MELGPRPKTSAPVVPVVQAPSPEGVGRSKIFERDLAKAREAGAPCVVLDMGPLAAAQRASFLLFVAWLEQLDFNPERVVLVNLSTGAIGHLRDLGALGRFRAHLPVGEALTPAALAPHPPAPPAHPPAHPPAAPARLLAAPAPATASSRSTSGAVPRPPTRPIPLPSGKPPTALVPLPPGSRTPSGRIPALGWSPPGFEILSELGRGGLATVYKARHTGTGRLVAVKVLDPRSATVTPQFVKLFGKEADILQRMDHENVLRGLGGGSADGRYYVLMEYVEGKSLQDVILDRGRLPEKEALHTLGEVTEAVRYLESEAFLHGDIKPGNIMIETTGRAKLCDLGMTNWISLDPDATNSAVVPGTKGYLSPEREAGSQFVDVRSEIYALGVTLHRMIAGFFQPGRPTAKIKFGPDFLDDDALSIGCRYLITRMTAPELKQRYVNCDAVLRDIGRVQRGYKFDKDLAEVREAYVLSWYQLCTSRELAEEAAEAKAAEARTDAKAGEKGSVRGK